MNKTVIGGTGMALLVAGALLLNSPSPTVVQNRPVITGLVRTNHTSLISFTTETNYFYTVWACTNIASPHWIKLYNETRGDGSIQSIIDNSYLPSRFYLVLRSIKLPSPPSAPPFPVMVTNQGPVL